MKAFCQVRGMLTSLQDELPKNTALCDWLRTPLEIYLDVPEEFTATLHTHTEVRRDGTRKVMGWKGIVWAFKEREVQLFRDTISTNKHSLSVATGAITLSNTTYIYGREIRIENNVEVGTRQIRSQLETLAVDEEADRVLVFLPSKDVDGEH